MRAISALTRQPICLQRIFLNSSRTLQCIYHHVCVWRAALKREPCQTKMVWELGKKKLGLSFAFAVGDTNIWDASRKERADICEYRDA